MDIETRMEGDAQLANVEWASDGRNYTTTEMNLSFALPVVTSFLSLLGSSTIVCMLLRRKYNRFTSTYDRIIFGMSSMDILSSMANMLATLPSPSHVPYRESNMRFPGYGTTATCTAQGFSFYSGQMGTTLYYCALSIYYVVVVTTKTSEKVLKTRIEPFFHAIPILYSFVSAIFLAVDGNFNTATTICWISPYPVTCRRDVDKCTRGRFAMSYRWIFSGIPVIIVFFVILTCMITLIRAVRKQDRRMQRYNYADTASTASPDGRRTSMRLSIGRHSITQGPSSSNNQNTSSRRNVSRKTQRTTTQALLYIAAYFTTFIFTIIFQVCYIISRRVIFVLFLLQQITVPAQGFFNFLVFIRPQIQNAFKNNPTISFAGAFLEAVKSRGENPNKRRRRSSVGRSSLTVRTRTGSKCSKSSKSSEISLKAERYPAKRMSVRSAALQAQKELMEEMKEELSLSSDCGVDPTTFTSLTKAERYPVGRRMSARSAALQAQKELREEMGDLSFSSDDSDEDPAAVTISKGSEEQTTPVDGVYDVNLTEGEDIENSMTALEKLTAAIVQGKRNLEQLQLVADSDSKEGDNDGSDDNELEVETGLSSSAPFPQDSPVAHDEPAAVINDGKEGTAMNNDVRRTN